MQPVQSQITFLYYRELEPIAAFFEEVLGFEIVEDQAWAKIYRVAGQAFLGIVAGDKGFHQPQDSNAVLITVVVDDAAQWYDYLKGSGVQMLTGLQDRKEIQIRCFFFQDPGGYTFEVQQFLRPEPAKIFGSA